MKSYEVRREGKRGQGGGRCKLQEEMPLSWGGSMLENLKKHQQIKKRPERFSQPETDIYYASKKSV